MPKSQSRKKPKKPKKRNYYTAKYRLELEEREGNPRFNFIGGFVFIIVGVLLTYKECGEFSISCLLYGGIVSSPGLYLVWNGRRHVNLTNIFLTLLLCVLSVGGILIANGLEGVIFGESLKWGYKRDLDESIKSLIIGFVILVPIICMYYLYKKNHLNRLLQRIKSFINMRT
jgi:hypothetical protein